VESDVTYIFEIALLLRGDADDDRIPKECRPPSNEQSYQGGWASNSSEASSSTDVKRSDYHSGGTYGVQGFLASGPKEYWHRFKRKNKVMVKIAVLLSGGIMTQVDNFNSYIQFRSLPHLVQRLLQSLLLYSLLYVPTRRKKDGGEFG